MTQDLSQEKRKPLLQKQGEFELIAAELAGSYQQVPQFSLGWWIADQIIFDFLEGIQEETFSPGKLPVQRLDDLGSVTETDAFQRTDGCSRNNQVLTSHLRDQHFSRRFKTRLPESPDDFHFCFEPITAQQALQILKSQAFPAGGNGFQGHLSDMLVR